MKKLNVIILAIVACLFVINSTIMHAQAATINKGIYVDGMDISGLSQEGAKQAVNDRIEAWSETTLTFTGMTGCEFTVSPAELGLKWTNPEIVDAAANYGSSGNVWQRYRLAKDIEKENINYNITLDFDKQLIADMLEAHTEELNQEEISVQLEKNADSIDVKSGQSGIFVDDNAADVIYKYLVSEWDRADATIEIPCTVTEPLGSNGELTQLTDIIGTYTTEYTKSSASRVKNVENGCRLITGATLYPGEQFSVLEHLVPFNKENGYELAGSYMNGLVVDTFGGGICQVSSTLYNAVLLAELQVDVRTNHSMIVDYVPASGDAAIAESSGKDFKFTNNKDFPIYIEGITTDEKTITFNIYGVETRPANRVVSFRSEVLERNVPETESIVQDASQPIGYTSLTSAHAGIKAKYYKIVTVDGVVESEEAINSSSYKMVPRTLVVGVATSNPDAYNQLQAAIATGSIDQTRATAKALASAGAAAPQEAAPIENVPAPAPANQGLEVSEQTQPEAGE